ncbi:MAG: DUF1223 domain-containing protein [Pyrinomonadaceae bacterium]|nr:DUF1223 domain-containing protein [Pyrinomonadaceae bacterium]
MKAFLFLSLIAAVITVGVFSATKTSSVNSAETIAPQTATTQTNIVNGKSAKKAVIVELFTSEGCSSCPPADETLSFIEREQPFANVEVIALSQHVDYWNQLGWKDPFSSQQFSLRQGEYSQHFGKNGSIYTPQMVVDGNREFVGSNMKAAQDAITEAAKNQKGDVLIEVGNVEKDATTANVKLENLPQITKGDSAVLLIAVTENNLANSVSSGENSGRKLAHTAVVRSLSNAGSVNNETKTISSTVQIGKNLKRENVKIVAFVQETGSRKILGASSIPLR